MAEFLTATLDDNGTQLAYIDSGSLSNETYTTIVIVHGFLYHSQIFSKLLPIAHTHNLRIVALNRRDYTSSTPFTPSELAEIVTSDESRSAFLQFRGLEIARFLVWVIKELKVPPAIRTPDGNWEGGLAIMGWSLGNVTTMAFLGHLRTYSADVIQVLEPYLKTFYLYDPDYSTLGYPEVEGGYVFYKDPSVPPEKLGEHFTVWVSSYYNHPYYTSSGNKERSISSLHARIPEGDEVYRPPTQETLTPEEIARCIDPVPMPRSDGPFMALVKFSALYEQTERGFFLDYKTKDTTSMPSRGQETKQPAVLPDINVFVLYCSAPIWSTTWCIWELKKEYAKWTAEGHSPRPIKFRLVDGADHFLHWDDPELFLKVVIEGLKG